ncbi:hypothetical protein VPH49_22055 [Pseudomonas luteola]|uniref:hypothetical protein n=1 Tax=Pseudomonas luteola TaxID=47886 RepID=UPI003A89636B
MNVNFYVIYSRADGAIRCQVQCTRDQVVAQLQKGESYIPGMADDATQYIDLESLRPLSRQDYPLEALPLPCTVTIQGVDYYCETQPTFTFDAPGTYEIWVRPAAQYLSKVFTYEYQP